VTVKAPLPRVYWILSGVLCLCTLVALWITAWKIREEKVAARTAGRQAPPSETDRLRRLPLMRGRGIRAGHFRLHYPPRDGALMVSDGTNQLLVTFTGLREGERRAWQELQIACIAADEKGYLLDVEFRPGSPCRGPGDYAVIKPGLRIELGEDRALVVLRWDPAKPELLLSGPGGEIGLADGGEWKDAACRVRLAGGVLQVSRD
jgi:hypothetical protein